MDGISQYYYNNRTNGADEVKFVNKKDNTALDFQNFLNIMITQLQNQDFSNPVNDSEYMSQMAQLSMLQQMQDVSKNSQYSFAASLLGKVVMVSQVSERGQTTTETGFVDSVSLKDDELKLSVNGKSYTMNEIVKIYDVIEQAPGNK